jgi:pyruvate/2-oxoglutarate dehydrogenase complex dihydrolipoamide dehydrogenase (E3) component
LIFRYEFKQTSQGILRGKPTGFCEIITTKKGQVIGGLIIGDQSIDTIQAIALAVRNNLHIQALADFPAISPSGMEIIARTAQQWDSKKHQPSFWSKLLFWQK